MSSIVKQSIVVVKRNNWTLMTRGRRLNFRLSLTPGLLVPESDSVRTCRFLRFLIPSTCERWFYLSCDSICIIIWNAPKSKNFIFGSFTVFNFLGHFILLPVSTRAGCQQIFSIFHEVYPDFWAPKMKNGAREARNCYSNRFKYKITGVIGNFRRPSVKQTGNPIHVKDSTRGCF